MNPHKLLFSTIMLFAASLACSARIMIVDNHVPAPAGTYATLQLAFTAATAGDTLLLTPSEIEYAGITATKKVAIIGNGWEKNSLLLPNTKTSSFNFAAGSEGSMLTGCAVNGDVAVNASSITIKRNKCNFIIVNTQLNNIQILQNLIISSRYSYNPYSCLIYIFSNSFTVISNNVLINTFSGSWSASSITGLFPLNVIITNNIISGQNISIGLDQSGNSSAIQTVNNNIVLNGSIGGVITPVNNICNSTQFPAPDGNIQNVDISTLFIDRANYDFHLKAGSPAIGAGVDGTDCGIYGGELGFVDKGIPNLPYIYYLKVPAIVNKQEGLNITVKAKSGL
jgi:hypothetical protein